jgi:hypothetical protein
MQCRLRLNVEPPGREAARAIDVQLKAVAGDVADGGAFCQPISMTQSFGLLLLQQ